MSKIPKSLKSWFNLLQYAGINAGLAQGALGDAIDAMVSHSRCEAQNPGVGRPQDTTQITASRCREGALTTSRGITHCTHMASQRCRERIIAKFPLTSLSPPSTLRPPHTAYALRLRDGYSARQNAKGAKTRRDCDGWLETAADDAAMAIQLALLFVVRNVHCTPSTRHLCPFERCLELAQPVSASCEHAPMQAGLRACTRTFSSRRLSAPFGRG
jgi:hypothetical protein